MSNAQYAFASRTLPLETGWDVVVVGGGPSGCAAAAASAREGAKTLLIEGTGILGGMGTAGLVPAWCPFSDKEQIIYRGIAERVFRESCAGTYQCPDRLDWVPIDPENLKRVYDNLVAESGATVRFFTQLMAVEKDGDELTLILGDKTGLSAVQAKVYIDCTGDGDLAFWAGAEILRGDDDGGELQPATHCFALGGVNEEAYAKVTLYASNSQSPIHAIVESGEYPLIPDTHICNNLVGRGVVGFNAGHIWGVDPTNPETMHDAMIRGRKMAEEFRRALADKAPDAFGESFVIKTGSLMGVRETRRIVGDYILTIEDYLARKTFEDDISRNAYPVDVHTSKKENESGGGQHGMNRYEHYKPGESHGIPYRCLTAKGLRNVLTAGRCISTDRDVNGSTRVMPPCLTTGEAAGVAAAMAAGGDGDVHAVDTNLLREKLRAAGAYLP